MMWMGDVFGRDRGEQIELEHLHLLFHRFPEMDILEGPHNHIVLGAKGCGKSTALRAMAYRTWRQRSPEHMLPFVGIYQPFLYDELCLFKTTFEPHRTSFFEHYFTVNLLMNVVTQLPEVLPTAFPLLNVLGNFFQKRPHSIADALDVLVGEKYALERHICRDPLATKAGSLGQLEQLSIRSVREFATRFAVAARAFSSEVPSRIGILLDSFDYYGPLGALVSPFLESDGGLGIVTKIAARRLDIRGLFEGSNRRLERHRDYRVLSLDRNSDSPDHFQFVREAICKRVRKFMTPQPFDASDAEILDCLFDGASADGLDVTSFDNFCRISSGNVLAVILLLDKAAELQRSENQAGLSGMAPIRRDYRLAAIREQSRQFWDHELGLRVPANKSEAEAFCVTALAMATKAAPFDHASPQFTLQIIPDKGLIAAMLANRVLVALDKDVNCDVQAGFDPPSPLRFELNRQLLPRFDRIPNRGIEHALDRAHFAESYKRALEERKSHMAPQSTVDQRQLFGDGFTVFLSMPFDPKRYVRTNVVRASLARLYKTATSEPGGPRISHIDVKCLPRTGDFRLDIPDYIIKCSYVLADITDVSMPGVSVPGVFYEIGLAVGERKPLVLFHHDRELEGRMPKFDPQALPPTLRGQSVLVWGKESGSFHDLFRPVHQKALSYNGRVPVSPQLRDANKDRKFVYLSFQPRHQLAQEWFVSIIRGLFPELTIIQAHLWRQEELWEARDTIAEAQLCVIDVTQGVGDKALELGIATATGRRRVLQVWNTGQDPSFNQVPMYPGKKWGWADLGESDRQSLCGALEYIAGQSRLGSRTP